MANGISKPTDKLPKSSLTRAITMKPRSGQLLERIVREAECAPDPAGVLGNAEQPRANRRINSIAGESNKEIHPDSGQKITSSFGYVRCFRLLRLANKVALIIL